MVDSNNSNNGSKSNTNSNFDRNDNNSGLNNRNKRKRVLTGRLAVGEQIRTITEGIFPIRLVGTH